MTHNFLNKNNNQLFKTAIIIPLVLVLAGLSRLVPHKDLLVVSGDTFSTVAGDNSLSPQISGETSLGAYPVLKISALEAPKLTSRSYIVYDTESQKVLASYNADEPLSIASLTKLTTAVTASRLLAPDAEIIVNEGAVASGIPTPKLGLQSGERIKLESLVEGMLVGSANDAAEAIAYAVGQGNRDIGIVAMNEVAQSIGLKNTHYANPTGFDDARAYSTASDVLTAILEVYRNPWLMEVLAHTSGEVSSVDGLYVHKFKTTSSILRDKTNHIIGGKTGFTDDALGNLAVFANSPNHSLLIAVLLGSETREEDMSTLLSWVYNSYDWK